MMRKCFLRFSRRHVNRALRQLGRAALALTLLTAVVALVRPLRNGLGYLVLPGAWRQLSTYQILRLYWVDPAYPVEMTTVQCDSVQATLNSLPLDELIADSFKMPVYDDAYFQDLQTRMDVYGTSTHDLNLMNSSLSKFRNSMTGVWQHQMLLTFRVFHAAMTAFNVSYFLIEGSMLGAYRHHGFIPWDDDMDICMNGSDWRKVKQILHCIPGFDVHADDNMIFKFFWERSPLWRNENFIRFPFIDIFFFNEDADYVWAMTAFKKNRIVFKKDDIFPLDHRPYEGLLAPVPRRMEELCSTVYSPDMCVSRDFDHMTRHFLPFYKVDYIQCRQLFRVYPFVFRHRVLVEGRQATIEYRKIGRVILSNFTVIFS